jgi:hypothetical protein
VGLDIKRFKKDMSGHVYASLIDESLKTLIDKAKISGRLAFVH